MAGSPRIGPDPLCIGLPEEIFGFEILVRLPAKDLVRCRAVCRAWRRLATTRDLLLAHHRNQPSLPLVLLGKYVGREGDLRAFHHRAAAGEVRLQPVARFNDSTVVSVAASCDGLLLLSVLTFSPYVDRDFICNPTTHQIGQLPEVHGSCVVGLYRHPPTGEYRLLLLMRTKEMVWENGPCYVLALGCNQLRPRCIGSSPELGGFFGAPVLVRGNLHWSWSPYPLNKDHSGEMITVFDATTESFRLMHGPVVQTRTASLYEFDGTLGPVVQTSTAYVCEVDGTLGVCRCNYSTTTVDIWVMQDYDSEVWSHKYHVKLPVAEIDEDESLAVMVLHEEGAVFLLYNFEQTLFLVDTEGKLLASSQLDHACISLPVTHRIKESLVQHSFFSALQGDSNVCSFIQWL
ncbi:unnamed protein product [Alopecurus aequalis]